MLDLEIALVRKFQQAKQKHEYILLISGQKFAMLEMKCTLAKILRNFELLPAIPEHKLVLAAETVLKSANGINIRLKKRTI